MSDDLVKQPALRRWQESVYGKGPYQVPDYESMASIVQEHEQMADRIEELNKQLEAARHDADEAEAYAWQLEQRLAKEAEAGAALAKAVSALNVIDALDPETAINGFSESALRGLVLRMGELARTTLAELKGENRG